MKINGKQIIRVFPVRTSHTPNDDLVFSGIRVGNKIKKTADPLFSSMLPEADEVHVSVAFTWDREEGERLARAWSNYFPTRLGGPAYHSIAQNNVPGEFTPGLYLKSGYTITSRGCSKRCWYCSVCEREDRKILQIKDGWLLQDNNILSTPQHHQEHVFQMLARQKKQVSFTGGIDATLLTDWSIAKISRLPIKQIFFAFDNKKNAKYLERAASAFSFMDRRKLRCYVLVGYDGDTIIDAESRLKYIYEIGMLPYAMAYRDSTGNKFHRDKRFRALARKWQRPIMIYNEMQR
jgi:hypothetical protein